LLSVRRVSPLITPSSPIYADTDLDSDGASAGASAEDLQTQAARVKAEIQNMPPKIYQHHWTKILGDIEHLAGLRGSGPTALDLIMALAENFNASMFSKGSMCRYAFRLIYFDIDRTLCGRILRPNNRILMDPGKAALWDVHGSLRRLCRSVRATKMKEHLCRHSVDFLRCCKRRRLMSVKVRVAVGHVFPPELVAMICEEAYDTKDAEYLLREGY